MFDSRDHNKGCSYSGETVAYHYDEMRADERSSFESHMGSCSICQDEVAAFSAVSDSISHWKSAEFDVLESPLIALPLSPDGANPAFDSVSGGSWTQRLRGIFELNSAWRFVSVCAVLALTIGAVWMLVITGSGTDIAGDTGTQEMPHSKSTESPAIRSAEHRIPAVESELANDNSGKTVDDNDGLDSESPVRPLVAADGGRSSKAGNRVWKAAAQPVRKNRTRDMPAVPKRKEPVGVPKTQTEIERLSTLAESDAEDTEEEGLRLTDLFAIADSD